MSKADELMGDLDLARRVEARRMAEEVGAALARRRCRLCGRLFVPASARHANQRYCSAAHRRLAVRRTRLALDTEITQAIRSEAAPRLCEWCGKELPPPGQRGFLRRYHDACRAERCHAAKRRQTPSPTSDRSIAS